MDKLNEDNEIDSEDDLAEYLREIFLEDNKNEKGG